MADPVYSDCGATVLANYQQVKLSAPPNLGEPIGFDQLPDGRIIQTARTGTVRLHNPATGTTQVLANFADPGLPQTQRLYTNAEDGLYGPAVDNDFATNHWVYLYYSPQTVTDVKLSDGTIVTQTTPSTTPPNSAPAVSAWDPYVGYFQLSRFKFVDAAPGVPAHLDLTSEQQILRVSNNRQECCHVAGDIDFDTHNNLWLVTGNDTPAGGIAAFGYGPFEDQLTDEQQTVRVSNATGGTFTLTFNGQTTAPLAFNATAAQIDAALEALANIGANNIQTSGGPVNTANVNVFFRRDLQQADQPLITGNATGLTGTTPTVTNATAAEGGWYQRPTGDARRSTLNTNDLRGKVLRIRVKDSDIGPADANKPDLGAGGAYTIPAGNLFPLVGGAPQVKTRPEVYAMGFQNPFRLQVDENDVAYVSDYSPDARTPQRSRGPAGVGRYLAIRHPANYGFPICVSKALPYFRWNFREFGPGTTTVGTPLDTPPQPFDCAGATIPNDSRWNLLGGPGNEPGLQDLPPITDPDIWYSYRDNNATAPPGTPCFGYYATTPGPIAPGSTTECPRLFPELFTDGVGPHGMAKYHYDPANPNPKKFPPYYDNSVILGEFTQDTLRELKTDGQNRVFKINSFLPCGSGREPGLHVRMRQPDGHAVGRGRRLLSAHLRRRLLQLQPRRRHVQVGVREGPARPGRRPHDRPDKRPAAADGELLQRGHERRRSGRLDLLRLGLRRRVAALDGSESGAHLHRARPLHGRADGHGLVGEVDCGEHGDHGREHEPDGCREHTGRGRHVRLRRRHPVHGRGHRSGGRCDRLFGHPGHVRARPRHARTRRGDHDWLFGRAAHRRRRRTARRQCVRIVSATYTDHGVAHDNVQTLSTTGQQQIRQKHHEVEFVLNQSGTNIGSNTRRRGRHPPRESGSGDWIQLNGPLNLLNIDSITFRVADAVAGRTAGSPLAAIEIHQDTLTGPIVGTFNLMSTGAIDAWTSQTFPISLAGTHALFLVFQTVSGGQTGGTCSTSTGPNSSARG